MNTMKLNVYLNAIKQSGKFGLIILKTFKIYLSMNNKTYEQVFNELVTIPSKLRRDIGEIITEFCPDLKMSIKNLNEQVDYYIIEEFKNAVESNTYKSYLNKGYEEIYNIKYLCFKMKQEFKYNNNELTEKYERLFHIAYKLDIIKMNLDCKDYKEALVMINIFADNEEEVLEYLNVLPINIKNKIINYMSEERINKIKELEINSKVLKK